MKKAIVAFVIAFLSLTGRGADIQKIIQDTQRVSHEPSRITLVWWIPNEFWEVVLRENRAVTDEMRAEFSKEMDHYLLLVVAAVDVGALGGMSPKDRAAIEANTELLIGGKAVSPLNKDDMSPDALNFVTMMKPMMANMLGQFGKGLEFFVYPNPAPGAEKIEAKKPGNFSYTAFGNRFAWRLPIGSLMPPKIDPKTKEVFPGDYIYNPYTGERLSDKLVPAEGEAKARRPTASTTNSTSSATGSRR